MSNKNQHSSAKISQQLSEKIARQFNLIFNQATIYHGSHPSVVAMIPGFYNLLKEGLTKVSPLTIMLEKESLYLEEWCIDKRVNIRKIVSHFKKAGVQSISFNDGMVEDELLRFLIIFSDLRTSPTVEQMKASLVQNRVEYIRLNYVIYKYKKVTEYDELVAAGEVMLTELEKSLSLANLLEDPGKFSQEVLKTGSGEGPDEDGLRPGQLVAEKLHQLGNEVRSTPLGTGFVTLESMMHAVFKMRAELQESMEAQKAMGMVYREEGLILDEAQGLTRQVIIRLIREEYNQGQISIRRLAQILRRMLPDVRELRRILPELKKALLADGMPLSDFLKLMKELARELQDEGLIQVLQEAAEEIGCGIEEMIFNIKEDPKSAAELITLAAEIRNAGLTGNEKLLTDLLVDYVERVGNHMAMEEAKAEGVEGGKHLHQLLSRIQMELVEQLRVQPLKAELVLSIDQRLSERIGSTLGKLKSSWVLNQLSGEEKRIDGDEIIRILENTLENERELMEILDPVRETLQRQGMSEFLLDKIYNDVFSRIGAQQKRKQWGDLPSHTLNRNMTLFLLDWEIQKAKRYPGTFSAILISIREIELQRATALDVDYNSPEIRNQLLERLRKSIRKVDIVGTLGENRILLLLPITPLHGARVLAEKIQRILKRQRFTLQGIPARVEFSMAVIPFSRSRIPTVESFIDAAEKSLLRVMAEHSKNK